MTARDKLDWLLTNFSWGLNTEWISIIYIATQHAICSTLKLLWVCLFDARCWLHTFLNNLYTWLRRFWNAWILIQLDLLIFNFDGWIFYFSNLGVLLRYFIIRRIWILSNVMRSYYSHRVARSAVKFRAYLSVKVKWVR